MITPGAKFWFALTAFGLVTAGVYYAVTGGEEFGTIVLAFAGVAAGVLGTMSVAVRDGDVPAPEAGTTVTEEPRVESLPAVWPVAVAVGAVVSVIGFAAGNAFRWVGLAILVAAFVEWMVQSWAERSTSDPAANMGLRNRVMFPVEIPILALLGVGLVVLAVSRVLLALPQTGSTVVAIVLATVVLVVASLLANRPRLSSSVLSGAVAVGAIVLVVGGIAGAVVGEREFEHHGDDHHDDETTIYDEDGLDAPGVGDDEEEAPEPGLELDDDEVDQLEEDAPETDSVGDPIRTEPDDTPDVSAPAAESP